jgi:hypothetical protein
MATENRHPDRDVGVLFSTPINLKNPKKYFLGFFRLIGVENKTPTSLSGCLFSVAI